MFEIGNNVVTNLFFGPLTATFLIGVTSLLLLYWYSVRNHGYWKKRGVPTAKTVPFLGSIVQLFTKSLHDVEWERFQKFGRIYGYFEGNNPLLSVAEPALLKQILIKDFQFFPNRRKFDFGDDLFNNALGLLEGEDWKRVRNILTPTFTTGKLKRMMGIFKECSMTLAQNLQNASGQPIDCKRMYGAFAMDTIASSAFSTKIDSHNDPDNRFIKEAKSLFSQNFNWRFVLFFIAPRLMRLLGLSITRASTLNFFKDVVRQIIEEREKTGQMRNDFLQLLLDTTKEVSEEQKQNSENENADIAANYGDAEQIIYKNVTSKHLSMSELVANCVAFFFAGFDATGTLLTLTTYLLAVHPDVQEKLRMEVNEAIKNSNGELTYESLYNMKYLDNVMSETLRIYPPALRMERVASADYKLCDTGITIPKGMIVSIPIYTLHRDPKSFQEPEKFDPDRFLQETRAERDPYAYMPFGVGPRNCIAMRFILLEVKVCLAVIIANFNIKTCSQTKVPIEFQKHPIQLTPKEVIVSMEPRTDSPMAKGIIEK